MKELIKNKLKMAIMVGPMNELERRLDETLDELFGETKVSAAELKRARRELSMWQYTRGEGSNFSAQIFALIGKADPSNTRKLMAGFPAECQAFSEWQKSPDPEGLLVLWGQL